MYEIIISNNIDIVNASRFKNNKVLIENYGYISSIFTYAFQLLCRILFNNKITDYTVGYRIYRTQILNEYNFFSNNQNFALESLISPLLNNKIEIEEIYYQWTKRFDGKSNNSFLNKLSYLKIVYKYFVFKILKF